MLDGAGAQRARVFGKREVRWREIANASSLGVLHRLCYLIRSMECPLGIDDRRESTGNTTH